MKVGINGDTIAMVADMDSNLVTTAKVQVDGKGQYLMPGLWDMHVHFRGGDTMITENKALLKMFLNHGVTTVRDAGGDITTAILEWKKEIAMGNLEGPDIFTSGPKLDGERPAWPGSLRVTSPEEVSAALDSLERLGVDYVKIYDGSLQEDIYYEIIKQAESRNLKVTGHMPMSADLIKAYNLGLDGIEHLYYVLGVSSPSGDSIRRLSNGYGSLPALIDSFDPETAQQAFETLVKKEFYATPTMHIGKVLKDLRTRDHSQDSLLSQMGDHIRKTYARRESGAKSRSDEQQEYTEKRFQLFKELIQPMHAAGITLLAGSDCGAYNSYVYPGASLQEELMLLTQAGLSPAESLATSIINGPQFFGLQTEYGTIQEGKKAHMLLLQKNPLEDIGNIKSIEKVIKGQKIHPLKSSENGTKEKG